MGKSDVGSDSCRKVQSGCYAARTGAARRVRYCGLPWPYFLLTKRGDRSAPDTRQAGSRSRPNDRSCTGRNMSTAETTTAHDTTGSEPDGSTGSATTEPATGEPATGGPATTGAELAPTVGPDPRSGAAPAFAGPSARRRDRTVTTSQLAAGLIIGAVCLAAVLWYVPRIVRT